MCISDKIQNSVSSKKSNEMRFVSVIMGGKVESKEVGNRKNRFVNKVQIQPVGHVEKP